MKDLFLKELLIKDNIIKSTEGAKDKYYNIAKYLKTQLKIPRLHEQFLKEKGSLDHFIQAKLSGDDEQAKWLLLNSGRKEISEVQKLQKVHKYESEIINFRKDKLNMYGQMDRAQVLAEHTKSLMSKQGVSIAITDQSNEPSQEGFLTNYATTKVFDINFKELILSEPSLKKRNSTKMLIN